MFSRLRFSCILLCALLLSAACAETQGSRSQAAGAASDFPTGPITLIVPFGAGGGSDLLSRSVSAVGEKYLGQPVRVELQPGASGVIATTDFVQTAKPDGHTLIIVGTSATTTVPITQDVQYHPIKDFSFVSGISLNTEVLTVSPDFPADTPKEFIEYARSHPGEIRIATTGKGGEDWAAVKLLSEAIGAEVQSVPFEGGGEAMTAAAGGHVDGAASSYASASQFLESGKLKAVGVFNKERSPQLPDMPTFAELGYNKAIVESRLGYAAPKDTPPAVVDKLAEALKKVANDPNFKDLADNRGFLVDYLGPKEYKENLQGTVQRMRGLFGN